MIWPDGKQFAFTVFDDTDLATLDNVPPVYDFLRDLGFRTTKSIWPIRGPATGAIGGSTCEDSDYLAWLYRLRDSGFEIGYHMASNTSSTRENAIQGLGRFREFFGEYPTVMANHSRNRENIYWGSSRLSGANRVLYNIATAFRYIRSSRGHVEGDPHFWGDHCKEKIKYCRSFVFPEINALRVCPTLPYHDADRPFVNYWFPSCEGPTVESFVERISEQNQDRLEAEYGACIMYTHFACGFYKNGQLDPRFRALMQRLSRRNGWFVPVSTLLDYLLSQQIGHTLTASARSRLERQWLWLKLRKGTS